MKIIPFLSALALSFNLLALPNPASENCIKLGGTLDWRDQSGICQWQQCDAENNCLSSECEEWALFRNECAQGQCKKWVVEQESNGDHRSYCGERLTN